MIFKILSALMFLFISFVLPLSAQDEVTVGSIRVDETFEHLSIFYAISGDDNRNSNLVLRYREEGAVDFKEGARTMRGYPDLEIDGNLLNSNFHAGSIMFLQPGTTYEVEMSITDPDGGSFQSSQFYSTKSFSEPVVQPQMRYVIPGNGGGEGTEASPYRGLQSAADNAEPGDHFIVAAGIYSPFVLLNSGTESEPISFVSSTLHDAVIDGANTDRGIITLGDFSSILSHVIIDGFKIENGAWGIDAQNTQYVTVKNNIIEDVGYGYVNRRENGNESDQFITNNLILGRTIWPQSGVPNERGIDIRGNNNVVSYNTIRNFGDGVSTDGPRYRTSYALDIHNNDIQNSVDDHIEIDGIIANARVYANRCYNGRAGVSVAPIYGGPAYLFRNLIFNVENSAFKINRGPSGIVIVHNTAVSAEKLFEAPSGWQNTFLRNNVFMGSRYCFEMFGLVDGSQDDWDYNAYYSSRSGEAGSEWFKWNNVRYADVPVLRASGLLEWNAISVSPSDFENLALPAPYPTEYMASERDITPTPTSSVIDNGSSITNLNLGFVTDGRPDRGALEYGLAAPRYGHLFDESSSVEEEDVDIEIYPNPFLNSIRLEGSVTAYSFKLVDVNGQLVKELPLGKLQREVDLGFLEAGIYFLNVSNRQGAQLKAFKLVKM